MHDNYLKILKNYKKKTAYIVFSAMSTPAGTFQMGKALANLPGLLILLNDKENNWYQYGLPEVGDNTTESITALKKELKKENIEQIICIGASMGGYGAALYGELLNADFVICFSSEIKLGLPFSRNDLHSNVDTSANNHDLSKIIGQNGKTKFTFFVGSSDIIDLYNASLIAKNSFDIHILKNKNHFLTQDIHLEFTLEKIITDVISGNGFSEDAWIDKELKISDHKNEIELLYNLYVSIRKREFEKCEHLISSINKLKKTELYYLLSGMYFSRQKNYNKAEDMLTKATNKNSSNRDSLFELAIVKRVLGKTDESITLYHLVLSIDPTYAPAHNHLGMIYKNTGMLNTSEKYFRKALTLKGEDQYRKNLIDLLESSIKDKQLQIEELLTKRQ